MLYETNTSRWWPAAQEPLLIHRVPRPRLAGVIAGAYSGHWVSVQTVHGAGIRAAFQPPQTVAVLQTLALAFSVTLVPP